MTITGDGTRNSVALVTAFTTGDPVAVISLLSTLTPEELTSVSIALSLTLVELVKMAETRSPGFTETYLDAIGKRAALIL